MDVSRYPIWARCVCCGGPPTGPRGPHDQVMDTRALYDLYRRRSGAAGPDKRAQIRSSRHVSKSAEGTGVLVGRDVHASGCPHETFGAARSLTEERGIGALTVYRLGTTLWWM